MTMSKTRDRTLFTQESGTEGSRAQPAADLATGPWGSLGSMPALYVTFALLSVLMMTLGERTYWVLDKLDYFPKATFIQLCLGVLALFGCDDNALHAMMEEGITDWAFLIGPVLEQLPTNKTFMSPWWMKTKMANLVGYIKDILSMAVLKMASNSKCGYPQSAQISGQLPPIRSESEHFRIPKFTVYH